MATQVKQESASTGTGDPAQQFIEKLGENEQSAMEAVRRFVDAVDGAFPDIGEDGPRRKIIDAAFKMAEQIVGASNQLALNIVEVSEKALEDLAGTGSHDAD